MNVKELKEKLNKLYFENTEVYVIDNVPGGGTDFMPLEDMYFVTRHHVDKPGAFSSLELRGKNEISPSSRS